MECMRKGCVDEVIAQGLCQQHLEQFQERKRKAQLRYQEKIQADPEKRAKANAYRNEWRKKTASKRSAELRERYANDPEFRERVKEQTRRWREKHPEQAEAQNQRSLRSKKEYYATNPEYREKAKERARQWRETNPEKKSEMDRQWREANPEKVQVRNRSPEKRARQRMYNAELKMEVLLAYGDGSCAHCGYKPDDIFELELHHVNGDGAEHRRRIIGVTKHRDFAQTFYRALRDQSWPTDVPLITLCANCHKKETLRLQRERQAGPLTLAEILGAG